jgi:peptidoglycan/LPS O-acetylase OafA/YrhL
MTISISNAVQSTYIFIAILALALVFSFRRKKDGKGLTLAASQEIKGFAILAIVFAHIGYLLASDNRFLFPLSIAAGIGVNLFFFLSGYGLTISSLAKKLSIPDFYKKRLFKLYLPFWLVLFLFLGLDFFLLQKTYGLSYVIRSVFGYFPTAVANDINSPFWYFTVIVAYYLLFPLLFSRKRPWLTALSLFIAGQALIFWNPPFLSWVMWLYRVHLTAFPIGILVASLVFKYQASPLKASLNKIWHKTDKLKILKQIAYWVLIVFLLWFAGFAALHSDANQSRFIEEGVSLIACAAVILFFVLFKFENKLLYWFGFFSYEIYLLHLPIMERFEIFYRFTPPWLATVLYLAFFLGAAWLLRWLVDRPCFCGLKNKK